MSSNNIFLRPQQLAPAATLGNGSNNNRNPFVRNMDSAQAIGSIGVNQPLKSPLFVGYRGNTAVYAGSRLFVLY